MPVHHTTPDRARKAARTLAALCHAVPLHQAQEAVAQALGHPHWHAMLHTPEVAGAPDRMLVPEAFRQRRLAQGQALAKALDIPMDDALWARDQMHLHGPTADADPNPPRRAARFLFADEVASHIPALPGRRAQGLYRVPALWRDAVLANLHEEIGDPKVKVFRLRWKPCESLHKIELWTSVGKTKGSAEGFEMQMNTPPGWDDAVARLIHRADPEDALIAKQILNGKRWV